MSTTAHLSTAESSLLQPATRAALADIWADISSSCTAYLAACRWLPPTDAAEHPDRLARPDGLAPAHELELPDLETHLRAAILGQGMRPGS